MPPPAPLALYIHLPFCRVKCSYCAFAISTRTGLEPEYMSALLREVETRIPEAQPVGSLYLGGGTPSLTSPFALQRLFDALGARIRIEPGAEITLEANPEDVTPSSVRFWRERLGINRLSLGVQSFHDQELIPLGRFHGRDGALAALSLLAEQTDLRTSLDLITGLPGQTVESFVESVEIAIQSGVGHVSIYMLDLEEGSALASRVTQGLIDLPAEEEAVESWLAAREALLDAGFLHYEISNYAKPGEQSRHNLVYWRRDPYVGLGLAAHSFLEGKRQANSRDIGE
ncbi:MAG TPA: radical SAM family heme chaperone HemW, partial [Thermoanaerobaculia bacterium]|nr:radical SAM family heme chaperone HemW [Thermoanaerobaculia bacterium]